MYAVIMTDGDYTSKPSIICIGASKEDVCEDAAQRCGDDEESVIMMRDELSDTDMFDTGHCAYHVVELSASAAPTGTLLAEIERRCVA
jgi:hypothetical protein